MGWDICDAMGYLGCSCTVGLLWNRGRVAAINSKSLKSTLKLRLESFRFPL